MELLYGWKIQTIVGRVYNGKKIDKLALLVTMNLHKTIMEHGLNQIMDASLLICCLYGCSKTDLHLIVVVLFRNINDGIKF